MLFSGQRKTIAERRSMVRVWVTRIAALYIFGGSAALIATLWIFDANDARANVSKDIFMAVLPVATGIVTYWFANRAASQTQNSDQRQADESPQNTDTENEVVEVQRPSPAVASADAQGNPVPGQPQG